ncbi:MAG TPA: glycosyltransferase [Streptosporangiaceae bacterium]|nr:glycosyltransferase [Streptosporangiaceae bacterium]
MDDASDDRTGELAAAAGGDRVLVVRRELPDARRGKGPALNAGFAHLLHDAGVRGTVSLGGNGQFTRLAALLEMGPAPWRAQRTEDLDLSLALAAKGWRLTSAPDAHVSQQGVTSLRALVDQRTRWYQGHMQAVRWLRELWTSREMSHLAMLELTIYLLVPWALVLPWSIIFSYNLLIMVLWVLGWVATPGLGSDLTQKIATLAFWYALSCLPIYMAGFLYGRQERKVGYVRAFLVGHLLLLGNYVTYVACAPAAAGGPGRAARGAGAGLGRSRRQHHQPARHHRPAHPAAELTVRPRPVAADGGQSPRRAGTAGPAFWPLGAALPS